MKGILWVVLAVQVLFILLAALFAPVQAQAPSYIGFVDAKDCNQVQGWAADRLKANTPIGVDVYRDGQLFSSITANGPRPDVGAFLKDNGLHGFVVNLLHTDEFAHSWSVRFKGSTLTLNGGSFEMTCLARLPSSPPVIVPEQIIDFSASKFRLGPGFLVTEVPGQLPKLSIDFSTVQSRTK